MTDWEASSIRSTMDQGNDAGSSSSSGVNTDMSKRKYGNPHSPQKERTLLVTKNKKIRQSQACDRCRLKKVKCDGLKPSCSQCLKVNFQCRTSDRLTRRGFPRGYTEMLESEVVRLQKLLEDKSKGRDRTEDLVESRLGVELQATSPKYEGDNERSKTDGQSFSEPQFPFINDTFHYYNNYREEENYLGHCTWNILTNAFDQSNHAQLDTEWLSNSHISLITNFLQLEPKSFFFPKFLLVKYENNLVRLKRLVKAAIGDFNRFQNSLIPLLHPFDKWQSRLMSILKTTNTPDPIVLLTLLYIIQLNWSCLDESKLFQLTKMICSSSRTSLKNLQCLLFCSFYFMGSQVSNKIDDSKIWASELLHMAYAMVLDLGLYINSNRQIPMGKDQKSAANNIDGFSKEGSSHDVKIISFWSFQFLDSWWSLIQGLPKSNFLVDEFHPQSVASLKVPTLKPFTLLLSFTVESLDGCNLLHTLSSGNNNGKSKLVYLAESFRQLLVKWKLYHQLQDHEDDFDPEDTEISLSLTKPDVVEIQLTLFYLIITFFSDEKIDSNINHTSNENTMVNSNLEDTAYEIISLYYLLLMDQSHLEQPRQFNILHILPCSNRGIINSCLSTLNDWAMSPQDANELEGQLNWKYNKYQHLLTQWCQLYYIDEPNDPLLAKLVMSYKIHLKRGNRHSYIYPNKLEYLEKVEQYNNNNQAIGRSNLVRSNSNAIMDQFDMFAQMHSMKPIFNNIQLPDTQGQVQNQGAAQDKLQNENDINEKEEQLTQNDNNNIIDMSHYRSQILTEHDETDDGYAEDDDEDDDDDLRPLEIPFSTKRTGSLFQNKQNQPPLHRQEKQAQISNRRRTLDHIILENKDYNPEEQPAVKKTRKGSSSNKPITDLKNDIPTSEAMQNPSSSDGSNAFHNYSINPPRAGPTTSGSHSTANNSGGGILPPPPPPRHDTLFDHSMSMNSSTKTGSNHSTHTPQIIETPRAFVDMLLLQSSDQQRTIANPSPSCTSSNIDKHSSKVPTPSNVANDLYKGT